MVIYGDDSIIACTLIACPAIALVCSTGMRSETLPGPSPTCVSQCSGVHLYQNVLHGVDCGLVLWCAALGQRSLALHKKLHSAMPHPQP